MQTIIYAAHEAADAYDLPAIDVLKAITLYPAQILGVDDKIGSLEIGKHGCNKDIRRNIDSLAMRQRQNNHRYR